MAENVVFLEFGSFSVYWYGLFTGLAVLLSSAAFLLLRKLQGKDILSSLQTAVFSLPAALVCGRIFYCWFAKASFAGGISDILNIFRGGYALYGALTGVLAVMMIMCRLRGEPLSEMLDAAAPAVASGVMIGRFASIVSYDDIGFEISKTDPGNLPFAIWSETDGAWILWVGFFEGIFAAVAAAFTAAIFVMTYVLKKHGFRRGNAVLGFMLVYGLSQTILESMRNDSLFMVTLGFVRISQIISIVMALAAMVILSVGIVRAQKKPLPPQIAAWGISAAALTAAVWCEVKLSALVMVKNYTIMGFSLAIILAASMYLYFYRIAVTRALPVPESQAALTRGNASPQKAVHARSLDDSGREHEVAPENRRASRERSGQRGSLPDPEGSGNPRSRQPAREENRQRGAFNRRSPQREAEMGSRQPLRERSGQRGSFPDPEWSGNPRPHQPAREENQQRGAFNRRSPQRKAEETPRQPSWEKSGQRGSFPDQERNGNSRPRQPSQERIGQRGSFPDLQQRAPAETGNRAAQQSPRFSKHHSS